MWGIWSHPVSGLTQETSPGSGSGPRGSGKQLDHGHRWPVPVEKSPLLNEHVHECATRGRGCAKEPYCAARPRCRFTAVSWGRHEFARDRSESSERRSPPRRPEPATAQGGAARGLALADRRGRRVRQDGGADAADRLPAGRPRRRRGPGAGHHVHQQGRRRDARTRGAAGRPAGAVDVGVDVPLHLRADPAQPGVVAAGAELQLLDLRRRRLAAAAADDRQGHGAGHQAVLAAVAGQRDLQPEERADRPRAGGVRRIERRRGPATHHRGRLRRIPAPAARGQRAGLRRPHRRDSRCAASLSTDCAVLPAAVPAHPGRRVSGHQPRAVRVGARTRRAGGLRRRGGRRRAGRAVCGGRRRPVDLCVPRRDDPQHRRLRTRLPQRHNDSAGAELPVDTEHLERGQLGDLPQRRTSREAAVDRRRGGRAHRRLRRRQRARRGALRRRGDRRARRQG